MANFMRGRPLVSGPTLPSEPRLSQEILQEEIMQRINVAYDELERLNQP